MHRAAVWQRRSNSNIKIVHNSIEHFLWNPFDFSFDDGLSCVWIVFTNFVFQVPPSANSQANWDLGNMMARGYQFGAKWVIQWCKMQVTCEVFKCSVREMRWRLIFRTKHLNTSGITPHRTDSFCVKPITPGHPIPKISTHVTIFWGGGTWKTEFVKTIHRQERTSDGFHKKCSMELWTVLMFELLLCCHTAGQCMERT